MDAFKRAMFGRRSEKLDADQLELALEDARQEIAEARAEAEDPAPGTARAACRRRNGGSLPRHLPRIEAVVEPEDRDCPCCGGSLHHIGQDVSERIDVIHARLVETTLTVFPRRDRSQRSS